VTELGKTRRATGRLFQPHSSDALIATRKGKIIEFLVTLLIIQVVRIMHGYRGYSKCPIVRSSLLIHE